MEHFTSHWVCDQLWKAASIDDALIDAKAPFVKLEGAEQTSQAQSDAMGTDCLGLYQLVQFSSSAPSLSKRIQLTPLLHHVVRSGERSIVTKPVECLITCVGGQCDHGDATHIIALAGVEV